MSPGKTAHVPERFPYRRWFEVAGSAGVELHIRDDNTWDRLDPIEDCALPPLLEWTQDLHTAALADYNERWSGYLEDGGYYEMSWPPEPVLVTEGDWDWDSDEPRQRDLFDSCESHLAKWEWHVTVTTWEWRSDAKDNLELVDVAESPEHVFTTHQRPRELIFGPAINTGPRDLLERLIGDK